MLKVVNTWSENESRYKAFKKDPLFSERKLFMLLSKHSRTRNERKVNTMWSKLEWKDTKRKKNMSIIELNFALVICACSALKSFLFMLTVLWLRIKRKELRFWNTKTSVYFLGFWTYAICFCLVGFYSLLKLSCLCCLLGWKALYSLKIITIKFKIMKCSFWANQTQKCLWCVFWILFTLCLCSPLNFTRLEISNSFAFLFA